VIVIDFISIYTRSFFNEEGDINPPKWISVLIPQWIFESRSN